MMCEIPEWLPPLVEISEVDGDVQAYLDLLYTYYMTDFVHHTPYIYNKPVYRFNTPKEQGKEESFWHILEGKDHPEPDPTLERHKRIRWVKPIIEAIETQPAQVHFWVKKVRKGHTVRKVLCISLLDFSYLVVLSLRGTHFRLNTGYPFLRPQQREKLRKEFEFYSRPENAIPL